MTFTGTAVAVIALAIALTVMWRHHWQGSRLTVALMLVGGFGIAGTGVVGDLLGRLGAMIGGAAEAGTGRLFGVSVPVVVIAVMVTWLVVDMRDRSIHTATPWIALALPSVLAVVGGIYIGMSDTALGAVGDGLTHLAGWLGALN